VVTPVSIICNISITVVVLYVSVIINFLERNKVEKYSLFLVDTIGMLIRDRGVEID